MNSDSVVYIKDIFSKLPGSISWENFLIYKFQEDNVAKKELEKPARIDAYLMILCTEGEIKIDSNSREYILTPGMLFISSPFSLMTSVTGNKTKGYICAIEGDSLANHIGLSSVALDTFKLLYSNPVIQLKDVHVERIIKFFSAISRLIEDDTMTEFKPQIVKGLINTFLYVIADYVSSCIDMDPVKKGYNKYTDHFLNFIKILSENYTNERDVSFYADKMCLTARHLTTLIRKVSGLTVSDWVIKFVINDAKYLLSYTQLSVKEISYKLNFPNQSFFCKYFKKHTGSSPLEYRSNN